LSKLRSKSGPPDGLRKSSTPGIWFTYIST
jgi:hypothetical protein